VHLGLAEGHHLAVALHQPHDVIAKGDCLCGSIAHGFGPLEGRARPLSSGMHPAAGGVKMEHPDGRTGVMDAPKLIERLGDLQTEIAQISAKQKKATEDGDHDRDAKLQADLTHLMEQIDKLRIEVRKDEIARTRMLE
jgi:hypothetical protein